MTDAWSREVAPPKPKFTIAVLILSVIVIALLYYEKYEHSWTPLERLYLLTYVFTDHSGIGHYRLLMADYPKGRQLPATDADVVPAAPPAGVPPQLAVPFVLSSEARRAGIGKLEWKWYRRVDDPKLHAYLEENFYQGQSLWKLIKTPLERGAIFLVVLLPFAIYIDRSKLRELAEGRVLRGPELVTRARFNYQYGGQGIGFTTLARLSPAEWLNFSNRCRVRIPLKDENKHIVIKGDTGGGKTSIISEILLQLEERGDTAIVFDPRGVFVSHFYNPARGDKILNPVDRRMPYWRPSDEVQYAPEAAALAASLFPEPPRGETFFASAAQQIFERLLRYRPSPQELTQWMSHWEEIDRRVAGTEVAAMLERGAPAQRAAVKSAVNLAAAALKLLPSEEQAQGRWSAAEWAIERQGWLFLTSKPVFAKQILPLTSLWLDSLILRLMSTESGRTVWMILDELASLQKLPQLPAAITKGRNANLRLVLGFQGLDQVEHLYGPAKTMLSQPKTKVFLRISEPETAKWVSTSIGDVEKEWLEPSGTEEVSSRFSRKRKSRTYHVRRQIEPLVMASEIQGLADLHGYVKFENLVVRAQFPYVELKAKQPAFLPRPLPQLEFLPAPEPARAAAASAGANGQTSTIPTDEAREEKSPDQDEKPPQIIFD